MKMRTLLLTCLAAWPAYAGNPPAPPAPPLGDIWWTSPTGVLTAIAYMPRTAWPVAPSISASTPGDLTVSCSNALGYYSRLGARVTVDFTLTCTPTYTTASGSLKVTGLPFAASSTPINFDGALAGPITSFAWTSAAYTMLFPNVAYSASTIQFQGFKSGNGTAAVAITAFPSGTAISVSGTVSYDTTSIQ